MSHGIDETYSVYNEVCRRARKDHTCDACEETISTGHRYMRVGIVFDGKGESVKRCLRCQAIHDHLKEMGKGDTWPAEKLDCGESYESHWDGPPPNEIAALAFALPGETERA